MTKDEALDLALEALETLARYENPETRVQVRKSKDNGPIVTMYPHKVATDAINAIKQARSAPAQEPVAFNAGVPPLYPEMKDGETISVEYTTPPAAQRQWVGLTDEEHTQIAVDVGCMSSDWLFYGAAVERALKNKNT